MDSAPKFTDSMRKGFQSTLPMRFRPPLHHTLFSTMKKPTSDAPKGEKGKISSRKLN